MVDDNIIYAAQMLLKNQSGNKIQGWMDTQCSKRKELFPAVPPYTQFIQILNTCNSHWFTLSNVDLARNSQYNDIVLIYDSAFASRVRMSLDIQMAICSILRPQPDIINFDVVDVQNQPNGSDCGLFAIAFATELVHGNDSAGSFFDTLSLRQHLLEGLERGYLDRFPVKRKRRIPLGMKIRKHFQEKIYCICRTVNDITWPMMCSSCRKWYHHDCEGLEVDLSDEHKFTCSLCNAALLKTI